MNYKEIYTQDYFSGKNSFFYSLGYGNFASFAFNNLYKQVEPFLRHLHSGRVLDVGCAYGFMLKRIPNRFEKFGIDISEHAIAEAHARVPEATLKTGNAEEPFPFPEDFFDAIICNDVIEHLEHPKAALENMRKALKPGGLLYLNTPNLNWVRKHVFAYADKKEHHISLFAHDELSSLLEKTGFTIQDRWTFTNIPLFIRFRSEILGQESGFICRKP